MQDGRGRARADHPLGRAARLVWRIALALGAGGLALALASCGVPVESSARALPTEHVAAHTTTTLPVTANGAPVNVYFTITRGRYVFPEPRLVKPHDSLRSALQLLLLGPTTKERATGLSTALGAGTIHLLDLHKGASVVTVDLNANFGALSGRTWVMGVAQIVYTVAANDSSSVGVQFQLDHADFSVPLANDQLATGPVHVSQYATVLSPRVTPKATSSSSSTTAAGAPVPSTT